MFLVVIGDQFISVGEQKRNVQLILISNLDDILARGIATKDFCYEKEAKN
jgi:hypothetical protein